MPGLALCVEHYRKHRVTWNGEDGRTMFYQGEPPYDLPNRAAWMDGATNGYASYFVGP